MIQTRPISDILAKARERPQTAIAILTAAIALTALLSGAIPTAAALSLIALTGAQTPSILPDRLHTMFIVRFSIIPASAILATIAFVMMKGPNDAKKQ